MEGDEPMPVYKWVPNSRLPATAAQSVGERLAELSGGNMGSLKARQVLDDAKHPDSPLHPLPIFKGWDRDQAAEAHWLELTRYVMRSIVIANIKEVYPAATTDGPIKMFFHSEQRGQEGDLQEDGPYYPAVRVLSEAEARQRTVDEGLAAIGGILNNLRHFPELERTLIGWRRDVSHASEGMQARLKASTVFQTTKARTAKAPTSKKKRKRPKKGK